jgi:hypothetical protein
MPQECRPRLPEEDEPWSKHLRDLQKIAAGTEFKTVSVSRDPGAISSVVQEAVGTTSAAQLLDPTTPEFLPVGALRGLETELVKARVTEALLPYFADLPADVREEVESSRSTVALVRSALLTYIISELEEGNIKPAIQLKTGLEDLGKRDLAQKVQDGEEGEREEKI